MELLHTIYLIAITAEAMSGAIMGMRRGMDLFGICLLGTVTALGAVLRATCCSVIIRSAGSPIRSI